MNGTIAFFAFGIDIDSGRNRVLPSDGVTTDIWEIIEDSYKTVEYSNCKFTDDFEQTITVPYFDGWQTVDTVMLDSVGFLASITAGTASFDSIAPFYYISARRYSSVANGALEFDIVYNPVMSLLIQGSTVEGVWSRLPSNVSYKEQTVISDAMKPSRYINLDSTEYFYNNQRFVFWVEITATRNITASGSTADRLTVYGFPIVTTLNANILYNGVGLPETLVADADETGVYFPTLGQFLNNPSMVDLDASVITDISIIRMNPYYYNVSSYIRTNLDIINVFRLVDSSGNVSTSPLTVNGYKIYNLSKDWEYGSDYRQVTGTITLSDKERNCGRIYVRDSNGNYVFQIPNNWFDSNNQLTYVWQSHDDYGQMYYHLGFDTADNIGIRKTLTLSASHLPYIQDAWTQYQKYSMAFDREQMYFSVAQTAIGAGVGLASGNEFAVGNAIGTATNVASAIYNQNLKERRIQNQPATAYALNYGINYIRNLLEHPYAIVIEMPTNLTDEIYNNYVTDYGYAVEGRHEQTIAEGYYQGIIDATTAIKGERLSRLNDMLRAGTKITVIS